MKKILFVLFLCLLVLSISARFFCADFYGFNDWGMFLFMIPFVYFSLLFLKERKSSFKAVTWFTIGCLISILLSTNYVLSSFGCKLISLFLGWLVVFVLDMFYRKKTSK